MERFWVPLMIFFATASRSSCATQRNDTLCSYARRTDGQTVPVECDWHYIAYFPRIFRTGIYENVAVSTHGFNGEVKVNVAFVDKDGQIIPGTSTAEKDKITPDKLTLVPLFVPHNSRDSVRIRISGTSIDGRWKFENTSKDIEVEKLGLNLFIQTDRPLYKPGEKIRFRVLCVDTKLKPSDGPIEQVVIENPQGSRMRQWSNVPVDEGFASLELKLSEKPVLGVWKIKASTKGYKKELKIEVKKYVLPKYQVTVTPPPYIVKMQKVIEFKVCAKYSYGKNVVGKLSVEVCLQQSTRSIYSSTPAEPPMCIDIFQQVDGCSEITVDSSELGLYANDSRYFYVREFTITASVKETVTGLSMSAEKIKQEVLDQDVVLSFKKDDIFKPGFALRVLLLAKRPDDTPVNELLMVEIKAESTGVVKPLLKKLYKVVGGKVNVDIPEVPFNAQDVRITATYTRQKLYLTENDYKRRVTAYMRMKPWYSPSHSYLKIEAPERAFKIGELSDIKVGYTSVDAEDTERKIYYTMMCAGNVAASGHVTVIFTGALPRKVAKTTQAPPDGAPTKPSSGTDELPRFPYWWGRGEFVTRPPLPLYFSTGEFSLRQQISQSMLPSCRLVIYYIRGEETVADNVDIDVVDEFENKVDIAFSAKEVLPGDTATLTVSGAPNSRFAIVAVDKSIYFLAKGNDLKEKQLLDIREKLDIGPGWVREGDRCGGYGGIWGFGRRRRRSIYFGDASDYVDSEKAFVDSGMLVLTSLRLDVRPCSRRRPQIAALRLVGRVGLMGGGRSMSIGGQPGAKTSSGGAAKPKPKPKPTRPRQDFPETWLWTDERLSADGKKELTVKVPDTITTWVASGFAISKHAGLGVAKPAEIRGFQPFFLSLTLPYSVIRGEDVTVPAAVFSYLDRSICLTIKVSLEYSKEFQMVAGPSGKSCLCGGKTMKVLFRIKPKKIGKISLQVSAKTLTKNVCSFNWKKFDSSVTAADILIKKLLVSPEGEPKEYTYSSFFCPKGKPYRDDIDMNEPNNLVTGSVYTKVTVIGDIMGPSLSSIDQLLAMPYGCGEQNMLKFAPNIFIMNYLKNTNQVTEAIKTKAIDYMLSGYQRELTYKHTDGSYSAFGERSGEVGSTWLTAFVLKSFSQARPWIEVDEKEIELSQKWFLNMARTEDSGCFKTVGSLHNKAMKGGVKTPVTLTAYVLISLLESDNDMRNNQYFKAAVRCVKQNLASVKDSYSLAIIAYAFAKLKDKQNYNVTMKKLNELAIVEEGFKHWEEPKKKNEPPRYWWSYQARSSDIEQTSYALLAEIEMEGKNAVTKVVPIVRWLSKQRNSLGGWASTQDTVLAMQALASFAETAFGTDGVDMKIDVRTTKRNDFSHQFTVNKSNALVLQRAEGFKIPSQVKVTASGRGCALIQVTMKYNVRRTVGKPMFELTLDVTPVEMTLSREQSCRSQKLRVCSRWLGEGVSNMALKTVQMISGFEVTQSSLENKALKKVDGLKEIELKEKDVVMYFNRLTNRFACVELIVEQTTRVQKTKPANIKVYDYYDTNKEEKLSYNFSAEQCGGKKAKK